MKSFYVYILATRKDGPIYVGVTNDITRRLAEHKSPDSRSFTWRYNINLLVYYESHDFAEQAIQREKQLKRWRREWKKQLIEKENPEWNDLADTVSL